MPADRSLADGTGDDLVGAYRTLRTQMVAELAELIRRYLATGALSGEVRRLAVRLLASLDRRLPALTMDAVRQADLRGRAEAARELRLPPPPLRVSPQHAAALTGRAVDLAQTLRATHPQIVTWVWRAYHETTLAASQAEGGTRLQQSQRTWERLVARGVTGFEDKAGKQWDLASYVEMATRTRLADTAVKGHLRALGDRGIDLVIVSNAPFECEKCRPWEGAVLTRSDGIVGASDVEVEHGTEDRMVTVRVQGTVETALRGGLMHPNCRHSFSAYLPGVTKVPTNTEDPVGSEARARLRELERRVRAMKLAAESALDPVAERKAQVKVTELNAAIAAHVKATPGLLRQRHRETIGTAR